jgi:N-acetylneuraminate synthase
MSGSASIEIAGRKIGPGHPVYMVAEMSGNHNQSFEEAVRIIEAAKAAGADAVKLQTYTADTITIASDHPAFKLADDTLWAGKTLHQLYQEAYTPWEWQPRLKEIANGLGMALFSSPFDFTAVDFLERMRVPAYKVASFEMSDIPLVEYMARTGKPVIMSTGMASVEEIQEAVDAARGAGCHELVLLKCTSAYPSPPEEMNITAIPFMADRFGTVVGLSDHTLTNDTAVAAVALGARVIEKHFTISRSQPGPDSAFSVEPHEFRSLVDSVRTVEKAMGRPDFIATKHEAGNRQFRRSLFVTEDVRAGEPLTEKNVRSIRPGIGLAPRHYREVLGRKAARDIRRGTPLSWDLVG